MSKTLRTAAIIVGAVALVATGVGAVAGAAAVGAAATGAASAATLAGVAATATTIASIATATAAAASLGAAVTARPPPLGGSATLFKADKDAGIPYAIGRTATGGNIIYRRTHNTAGYSLPDLQTFGVVLSGAGPINAIESFEADRVTVSFSSGAAVGSYAGWMWQTQQLGASPESAALRVTPGGTLPPGWTTAAKLSGMAAAMWTLRYDQKGKFYAQGVPVPRWIVQGVKVYDPRLDSTYPGGSGSCRAGTESTYVYSENPYLHALSFALGRYQNGKRVIGIGTPVAGIDVRAFVEGANVADANGWTVGGVITSADNKWAVLKTILQAGGGEPMHLGALLSCKISTPRVTLATVTTDDLIGTARVTATTSRRDRFNTVIARYRSEAHDWEMIPAEPVAVTAHITTDGGARSREITYSMVQDLDQAAELARYDIENAREFGPIILPLKLRWIGYRPGDCIAVNLPEVGLNGQQIVIGNREIDAAGLAVTLTGRSETAAKHPFALGQTGVAPPTPSVSTPPTPPQPGAVAWSLSGAGLVAGATITPALIITGAAASVPIDAVVIDYRLWVSGQAADAGWIGNGAYLPDVARVEITAVLPSTAYEVAVSYRLGAFTGPRRIIGPVTTTAAGLAWTGVTGPGKPKTYRVRTRGFNGALEGGDTHAGLWDEDTQTQIANFNLMYTVCHLPPGSSTWQVDAFDTLSNPTTYRAFNGLTQPDRDHMAYRLNQICNAYRTCPVVVLSYDEPQTGRLTAGIDAAMYRCGASRAVFGSARFPFRAAYVLVGQANAFEGNGAEYLAGIGDVTQAQIDLTFGVVDGILSIAGVTPSDARDLVYSGGISIESLKPFQVDSDRTNLNTAAALAGQGALATSNVADWPTQVTGTGKPTNYADVTGTNTAAAIAGQGALATQNTVDWATQIIGAAKVAGNLLTDPITLTDLNFPNGNASRQVNSTGTRLADRFRVYMTANTYFGWMADPGSTRIPVFPGQVIFYQHAVFTTSNTGSSRGLFNALNAEGNYVGTYEFTGSSVSAAATNGAWVVAKGSVTIPAGVAFIWPHAVGVSLDSPAYFGEPFVGYHAAGADITAINTAAAIAGQGALATLNSADWVTRVSGTGKPANNADVTAANTAAAIVNQGALATRNTVDFATDITGVPPGFGQVTVGNGQSIQRWMTSGQSVAVSGAHGATTGTYGDRSATLLANGSVFATGTAFLVAPGEPNFGEVSGTYTHSGDPALVSFTVGYSGTAYTNDTTKIFCRA